MAVVIDYARKTYRYLRIAIASIIVALLIAILLEYLRTGRLLGSISSYYYTPVHALFIGSLIMIGVCLIAIRGTTDVEDIALNISGMLAPIVALVPTNRPNGYEDYPDFFPTADILDVRSFEANNVGALAITAGIAIALVLVLNRLLTKPDSLRGRPSVTKSTKIGFALAAAVIVIMVLVHVKWGSMGTHIGAAIGTFAGLMVVATANALTDVTNADGKRSFGYQLWVGLVGSGFLFGVAATVAGVLRIANISDGRDKFAWLILGAGLVMLAGSFVFRTEVKKYFGPLRSPGETIRLSYLLIAITMMGVGPFIALWPGEPVTRVFWVELVELVPFGVFWIVQTVERWNPTIDTAPAATESRRRPETTVVPML